MRRREFLATALASTAVPPLVMAARKSDRLKVGQIGTKHGHAGGKLSTLLKFPELFEVVGVVEPDEQRQRALRQESPWRDVLFVSEAQLLKTPGLQAVAIETEVRELVPTAQRCVDAGLHIHLDKPAGESLPAFRTLLEAAARKKTVVQMGYMFRYNPAFRLAYQAVREGWLGRVFEVHAVMSKQISPAERQELAVYPGGSMFELGCHLIDSLITLLGKPARITPYARSLHPDQDRLVDNQLAVFEYPDVTATIRSTLVEPFGNARRQFTVCGEAGTIEIYPLEPPKMRMALSQDRGPYRKGWQEVTLPKPAGRYDEEFRALARMIRGEQKPEWSADHDLLVEQCVLEASGLPLS